MKLRRRAHTQGEFICLISERLKYQLSIELACSSQSKCLRGFGVERMHARRGPLQKTDVLAKGVVCMYTRGSACILRTPTARPNLPIASRALIPVALKNV